MLVANTDSGNACPTSASSASATVIETIASSNGTSPATTEPNTINSTISAAGNPNPSSPLRRSSPASVDEVGVERELAGDRDVESVATVGALHGVDDILDVVLGIAAERHQHPGGIAIPRTPAAARPSRRTS